MSHLDNGHYNISCLYHTGICYQIQFILAGPNPWYMADTGLSSGMIQVANIMNQIQTLGCVKVGMGNKEMANVEKQFSVELEWSL